MTLDRTRIRPLPRWTAKRRDIEDAERAGALALIVGLCVLMFQIGYFAALAGAVR